MPFTDKTPTPHELHVVITNKTIMIASYYAKFDLNHMSIKIHDQSHQKKVHSYRKAKYINSLGWLCDNGCKYVFLDKNWISVIQNGTNSIILHRDLFIGLCPMNMHPGRSSQPLILNTCITNIFPEVLTNK